MIRAKNYKTAAKFVKVMPRILWPFPGHGVYSRQQQHHARVQVYLGGELTLASKTCDFVVYISQQRTIERQAGRRLVRSLLTICDIGVSLRPWSMWIISK